MVYADFQYALGTSPQGAKVGIIDWPVVRPFVDLPALVSHQPLFKRNQNEFPKPGDWLPKPPGACGLPRGPGAGAEGCPTPFTAFSIACGRCTRPRGA